MIPRTSVATVQRRMSGKFHAHGCNQCGLRYTDSCRHPEEDGPCHLCRGRERPLWERNSDPVDCCATNCYQVNDAETLSRYSLGGSNVWFKCRVCARTHPYDPKDRP